jgi:hypothetical protein
MHRSTRRLRALSVLAALAVPLTGCAKIPPEEAEAEKAATVEKGDSGQNKVVLIDEAAERLGIETAEVAPLPGGQESVPYSAVIYDAEGHAWVFTSGEALSYVKQPITIDRIEGDTAILAEGPPVGTAVVSQGAEELFGIEDGIGEFE